jgi:C-terminal processing protease CtpA/Prc
MPDRPELGAIDRAVKFLRDLDVGDVYVRVDGGPSRSAQVEQVVAKGGTSISVRILGQEETTDWYAESPDAVIKLDPEQADKLTGALKIKGFVKALNQLPT